MDNFSNLEREPLKINRLKALLYLIENKLKLKVIFDDARKSVNVAHVLFTDVKDNILSEGSGKGEESVIGAIAECLEHFCIFNEMPNLKSFNKKIIYEQKYASHDGLIQSLQFVKGDRINCIEFTSITPPFDTLFIPAVLVSYNYLNSNKILESEKHLIKYYTNSGTAFGCTINEAIVHGVNEVIERDSLSKLYNAIIKNEKLNVSQISNDLLFDIFKNNNEVQHFLSSVTVYFDNENTITPFSFAILKKSDHPITLVGSGCSVFSRVAIYRAVTELYQIYMLYDNASFENDKKAKVFFENKIILKKLIDLSKIITHKRISQLPQEEKMTISQQVYFLENKFKKLNKKIYVNVINEFQHGFIVAQIYINGMDRFELVRSGMEVIPQHLFLEKQFKSPR